VVSNNSKQKLYQSEVIQNNANPLWKPFTLELNPKLANSGLSDPILIECFDKDPIGQELLGTVSVIDCTL
jgi:hypothetical protein